MDHVSDSQLLDLISGHLSPGELSECTAHIQECRACTDRWQDLKQGWDVMGILDVGAVELDLRAKVLAVAERTGSFRVLQVKSLWRIAASIGVGLMLGYLSGQVSNRLISPSWDRAVRKYNLDVLALDSPTGLAGPLLVTSGTNAEVQRP